MYYHFTIGALFVNVELVFYFYYQYDSFKNIDLSVYKNNNDIRYLCFPTITNVIQLVQHKYMQSRYWIQAISNYTPSEIEYKLKINPVRITKSKYDYSPIPKTQRRSGIIIDNQLRFCKVFVKMNIDRLRRIYFHFCYA